MPEETTSYVTDANITDIQKRKLPTKHYVYIINVLWNDGKKQVICRRYNAFFELQTSLIDSYPTEAGVHNPTARVIPFLPGKVLFGRSNVREVALKRKDALNEYLEKLVKLPAKISQCKLVLDFLRANEEDVKNLSSGGEKKEKKEKTADSISDPVLLEQYIVLTNFKSKQRNQVSLAAGDTVEVIEKHENGWWFVCIEDEQGWAPSSYLEPLEGSSSGEVEEIDVQGREGRHICTKPFKSSMPDELNLEVGDVVDILAKCSDGWWKVMLSNSKQGYVPLNHLKKIPKNAQGDLMKTVLDDAKKEESSTGTKKSFETAPRKKTIRRKAQNEKQILQKKKSLRMASAAKKVINMNNISKMVAADDDIIYYANEAFKGTDGKLTFSKGQEVEVVEKSPNGWWFVKVGKEEGWVPSHIVQRHRGHDIIDDKDLVDGQKYKTLGGYKATEETGISFEPGQIVEVLEKDPAGWWFVKIGDEEGWAPSTFLGEIAEEGGTPAPAPQQQEQAGDSYITLSDYKDPDEGMLSFKKGQKVLVLEKDDGGWWLAKCGAQEGWVPSNFLKKEE